MTTKPRLTVLRLAVLALIAAGCSGEVTDTTTSGTSATTTADSAAPTTKADSATTTAPS